MADVTISGLTEGLPNKNSAIIPYSDGTTTLKTAPSGIVAASPGSILQVVQAYKTNAEIYSGNGTLNYRDIPGLSCNIIPKASNSKVMVSSILYVDGPTLGLGCRLMRNNSPVGNSSAGNINQQNTGASWVWGTSFTPIALSNQFLDSSSYTLGDTITYKLQLQPLYYTDRPFFVNRSIDGNIGMTSSLTLMEIAG